MMMKLLSTRWLLMTFLSGALVVTSTVGGAVAASSEDTSSHRSWAGTSNYFLYACNATYQQDVLAVAAKAQLKVMRLFILGTTGRGAVPGCDEIPDLEHEGVGIYDDTILERIDELMVRTQAAGIKLTLALHDRWSLGCWRTDSYARKFNLPVSPNCATQPAANNAQAFYHNETAIADFENRISHILSHRNPYMGNQTWSQLDNVIFSVEPENEAQSRCSPMSTTWFCNMAAHMQHMLKPGGDILVTSGGTQPSLLSYCAQGDVDVVALHAYTSPLGLALQVLQVQHIATALKARWIVQEFGVTNTNATARQVAYSQQIQAAASTGGATPWSFWCLQITSAPNPDSLALWVNDPTWSKVIVPAAAKAAATSSPLQAWPEIWGGTTLMSQ